MAGFTHRKVTELKVMIPTATVTVIHHIYTPKQESDYHKEQENVPYAREDDLQPLGDT